MGPTSITKGTNQAHGGGKGYPKINENMKKKKRRDPNVKNQNKEKRLFCNVGRFSYKSDGSAAGRLPMFYERSDKNLI